VPEGRCNPVHGIPHAKLVVHVSASWDEDEPSQPGTARMSAAVIKRREGRLATEVTLNSDRYFSARTRENVSLAQVSRQALRPRSSSLAIHPVNREFRCVILLLAIRLSLKIEEGQE
jgi:hypothetical protein